MKKLSLLLITLILTITTHAQSFDRVIKATKLKWQNEEWKTVSSGYPTDMFIIVKEDEITVGKYKFKTYDKPNETTYPTHICFTWKTVNQNGEKCLFMMKKFLSEITRGIVYSIVYPTSELMYEYETE